MVLRRLRLRAAPLWRSGATTTRCEKIDCSEAGYPYFQRLADDVRDRTETAMPQAHCFKVCELSLQAQAMADADAQARHERKSNGA